MERRSRWNERTLDEWALPTEIWRETVERLQRYQTILAKIESGEIHEANDFITYNLDIRQFVQDFLAQTDDHLFVLHFYHALQRITILDPTCGSGAFLFAALNILEPLYETCIDRMQAWAAVNPNLFKDELQELNVKYRSNQRYFIYKSIILRNLYGVDIMVEATEIAKLRLFLKMVAVVDVNPRDSNLGIEPLPDVDFNIRCGNTLVGYANEKDLQDGLLYTDLFARQEFEQKVNDEMKKVSMAYDVFKQVQLGQEANLDTYKGAKKELKLRLKELNKLLNKNLHAATSPGMDYAVWEKSHQPFHWLAEYYDIIQGNGGFDVIIGNPPYVEYNKKNKGVAVSDIYRLNGYRTIECGNLYAFVIERTKSIIRKNGKYGMIIPISSVTTPRMRKLIKILYTGTWFSFYDFRPGHLFDGVNLRLCVFVSCNNGNTFSTKYNRWYTQNRHFLFQLLIYNNSFINNDIVIKISNSIEESIYRKIIGENPSIIRKSDYVLYYHDAILYWLRGTKFEPSFEGYLSSHVKTSYFSNAEQLTSAICLFNSNMFYWFWTLSSNCRDFGFDIFYKIKPLKYKKKKKMIVNDLMRDLKKNSIIKERNQKLTGLVRYREFYPVKSKPIIDEIDKVLAKHYGFTDEELDYIINYDIKYRMGDELNNEE